MHPRKLPRTRGRGFTSSRLAKMLRRSKSVVDHWLADPKAAGYKEPPTDIKDRISEIWSLYLMLKTLRKSLPKTTYKLLVIILDEEEDLEEQEEQEAEDSDSKGE